MQVEYSTRFVLGMFFNEPVDLGVDWSASYIGNHPILRFVSIDNLKRGLGNESPTSVMIWLGLIQGHIKPWWPGVGPLHRILGAKAQTAQSSRGRKALGSRHGRALSSLAKTKRAQNPQVALQSGGLFLSCIFKLKPMLRGDFLRYVKVGGEYDIDICTMRLIKWVANMCWQVHTSYPGSPGSVEVSQKPPLLLGGDAFAPSSNFSGCLKSAHSLVEHLKSAF